MSKVTTNNTLPPMLPNPSTLPIMSPAAGASASKADTSSLLPPPPFQPLQHPASGQTQTQLQAQSNNAAPAPAPAPAPAAATAGAVSTRPSAPPLDQMRAYRACLNCRNRKSKCDLDFNNGRPPCRRCQREARDCVLGESHRGGRRVRKKPKLDETPSTPETATPPPKNPGFAAPNSSAVFNSGGDFPQQRQQHQQQQATGNFHNKYDTRNEALAWPNQTSTSGANSETSSLRHNEQVNIPSHLTSPANATGSPYQDHQVLRSESTSKPVHENIASADLQNPSDALEILAHVADRAEDGDSDRSDPNQIHRPPQQPLPPPPLREPGSSDMIDQFHYPPMAKRLIGTETIYQLFINYEEFFHPYFPIIPRETFDRPRLAWLSRAEPHLFSAVLTIASKDNEQLHHVCYEHMQQLISTIMAGGEADVEAVEALLLLSQWVSHRPQQQIAVGRGEEDRTAWMYIGTALRLAYFLGLDRTAFKSESAEPPARFNRKRLVWAACYICDRQVSVRLGKGFWSRGPGPLSGLKSSDFPALQPRGPNQDNWALIFQANLELTQIFSNVHDILYASKGHGWKEMLEGRYAKYLDDFRTSIRSWNDVWGTLICSARLKASLMLTYDYLRLYVNAFAYQATISRALIYQRDSQHTANRPMPLINSTAPDARFIYEALDAAKSLLSTFNNFVDPETLRYMPSSYYLYIIYSAVFLYKARSTTTMTEDERTGVRRMINQTIDRLQKASAGANHMGTRYSRLIQMLWRKSPKGGKNNNGDTVHQQTIDGRLQDSNKVDVVSNLPTVYDPNSAFNNMGMKGLAPTNAPNGTFSWLDLGATWNFATQGNTGNSVSGGSAGEMEDMMGVDTGMSPFDMGLLTDYKLLDGDNPNFIF
ncbi:hypothetical protein BP5796_02781 [Coleophoma crateriformis]|uniref:Zn(2)-C6 fungal-type domain-containing protein n=1 Tax=Coleophoma crateriformis TaxID=565419 RepID=A0A3D8SZ91_9HELO|nr:hypothetical protein BP5796_02781 [Coleophoma crateriformis]